MGRPLSEPELALLSRRTWSENFSEDFLCGNVAVDMAIAMFLDPLSNEDTPPPPSTLSLNELLLGGKGGWLVCKYSFVTVDTLGGWAFFSCGTVGIAPPK